MNKIIFLLISVLFIQCNTNESSDIGDKIWIASANLYSQKYETTIGEFREFVKTKKYTTTADSLKWSGVFNYKIKKWDIAENANWEKPKGKEIYKDNFPVTQISYYDACAYCYWKGGRLPTAAEWDKIAGDKIEPGNIWQGAFPIEDKGDDGYAYSVAPVGKFKTNTNRLHDIFGNVWEWTTSKNAAGSIIIKGGSFLCDQNFCSGYYPSKYQTTEKDSGLNHLGFRCVFEK